MTTLFYKSKAKDPLFGSDLFFLKHLCLRFAKGKNHTNPSHIAPVWIEKAPHSKRKTPVPPCKGHTQFQSFNYKRRYVAALFLFTKLFAKRFVLMKKQNQT